MSSGSKGRLLKALNHPKFKKESNHGQNVVVINIDQDPESMAVMGACVPCPLRHSTLWCSLPGVPLHEQRYMLPKEQLLAMGVSLYPEINQGTGFPEKIMADDFSKEELKSFAGNGVHTP